MSSKKTTSPLVSVGFKNSVAADKVVAVVSADAAPIKRLKDTAKKENRLIDATNGRRTSSVLITVSNHVILSSAQPETIMQRF
jgi:extracellular matrix regulatory protein A